jgi:hypothetical protein
MSPNVVFHQTALHIQQILSFILGSVVRCADRIFVFYLTYAEKNAFILIPK